MDEQDLIVLAQVDKRFDHDRSRTNSLRQKAIRFARGTKTKSECGDFAIRNINFRLRRRETVGIVGDNGAGKSTLLRLMARIYAPSFGRVSSRGRIGAVLELGAGFHKQLTGADNLAVFAAALGLSRAEFEARTDEMVAFADIGDVLNRPIKYYSTGMQARLAIAVATCDVFDAILLDEALAVGDKSFRV